ncbi:MAG TPA: dienelactone hydrolase family protein [Verrucomicrobiae bacterium]|nr:dienelactone hydrolase family protein [Verrucomicrobiae bacterium]
MTRYVLSALLLAGSLCAQQSQQVQPWARERLDKSSRHAEWVTVKHDGRSLDAFVVYPEVKEKAPVVLVIHEIFGMSDWVQLMADELAAAGYVAIAPDLLSGMGPNGGGTKSFAPGEVGQAINRLPPDQITADLNASADWALKQVASNGRLFVAGFCYGGTQTFRYATNRPDLKGAFVFYGSAPPPEAIAKIQAPVYGFYAEMDNRITGGIPDAQEKMKAAGKTYEPVVYAGAGHGFMRSGDDPAGTPANVKARNDAFERLTRLLKQLNR